MAEIEYCYHDGDLDKALAQAALFVKKHPNYSVQAVATTSDDTGWTVIVVYLKPERH